MSDVPCLFLPVINVMSDTDEDGPQVDAFEVSEACIRVSGPRSIEGVQKMEKMYRIYPMTREAYHALHLKGIAIRGQHIELHQRKPFQMANSEGEPMTRLTIGNVPMSVATEEITNALDSLGVKRRSPLCFEMLRNKKKELTSIKSGRRFVYIDLPKKPLEKMTKACPGWRMFLYYREQQEQLDEAEDIDSDSDDDKPPPKDDQEKEDEGKKDDGIQEPQPNGGKEQEALPSKDDIPKERVQEVIKEVEHQEPPTNDGKENEDLLTEDGKEREGNKDLSKNKDTKEKTEAEKTQEVIKNVFSLFNSREGRSASKGKGARIRTQSDTRQRSESLKRTAERQPNTEKKRAKGSDKQPLSKKTGGACGATKMNITATGGQCDENPPG